MTRVLFVLLLVVAGAPLCARAEARRDPVLRANEMLARGDTSSAVELLEHSHLADHDDPRAHILLGQIFRDRGTIDGRLRSQHVLEDARLRFPRDASVQVELGRTYFAQRFFPDAIGCLHRALELDPKRCDARYLIGLYYYRNWKRMNQYKDDLDASRRHLREAWECDPDNADAARLYLSARYALADTSAREADRFLLHYPGQAFFHLYRGALAYDARRYEPAGRHFERGLELLPRDERAAYEDLTSVLPVNSLGKYREIGPEARDVFRRGYWLAEDPDPTTLVNERELEHIYRVFISDMLFSNDWTGRRGWACDRGGAMIKFGRPMSIDHTLGAGQSGHMEIWTYARGHNLHQFRFIDEFLNGDPRIPYDDDFVLHNMLHDPEFTTLAADVPEVPALLDVTAFRDDDLHASLYVALRVNADSVETHALPGSTNIYLLRGALFDAAWNREGFDSDTLWTSQLPPRLDRGWRVIEFVRRVSIPFGAYRVAWSLQDEHVRVRALGRGEADARRFAGDGLALSDVLLYDEPSGSHPQAAGVIDRAGMRMRPRVEHLFSSDEPLHSYVEVYGLGTLEGESEFEVRYSIYPSVPQDTPVWFDVVSAAGDLLGIGDEDPVISQSFTRRTTGHRAAEYIAIDIATLQPGSYELLVEVMDLNSGQHAARRTGLFVESGASVRR